MEWLLLPLVWLLSGSRTKADAQPAPRTGGSWDGWVWPMPELPDGTLPTVSDGWGSKRDGGKRLHAGVDVMYQRPKVLPKGTQPAHESRGFYVPAGTQVLAAYTGRVWSAGLTSRGYAVVIDHGPLRWTTFYQHLDSLYIPAHRRGRPIAGGPQATVQAGEPLGTCGYSPLDSEGLRHLHFELRDGSKAVDPGNRKRPPMSRWRIVT